MLKLGHTWMNSIHIPSKHRSSIPEFCWMAWSDRGSNIHLHWLRRMLTKYCGRSRWFTRSHKLKISIISPYRISFFTAGKLTPRSITLRKTVDRWPSTMSLEDNLMIISKETCCLRRWSAKTKFLSNYGYLHTSKILVLSLRIALRIST